MSYSVFNGAPTSRPRMNLGGILQNDSQSELIQRAKREREERESLRIKQRAALRLQAFYRGRKSSSETKIGLRQRFDATLLKLLAKDAQSSDQEKAHSILLVTRLLPNFYTLGDTKDLSRAGKWARLVLSPLGVIDKVPALFGLRGVMGVRESWNVLVKQIVSLFLRQAASNPNSPQIPLFLEITKLVCDPASYSKYKIPLPATTTLERLVKSGLHTQLRSIITAIPLESRTHPALPPVVALSLLPFKAFPAPPPSTSKSAVGPPPQQRIDSLHQFALEILSIPSLPQRIPPLSLTSLSAMPFDSILAGIASTAFLENQLSKLPLDKSTSLLANISVLRGNRVSELTSGKALAGYLSVVQTLLDRISVEILSTKRVEPKKAPISLAPITIDSSDDEEEETSDTRKLGSTSKLDRDGDVEMGSIPTTPAFSLDSRTFSSIRYFSSSAHLTAILTLSTRFSASTRPALAAFLVSLLSSFPHRREDILNTIIFASSSAAGERGGGLLRELWRGYIRSSTLGKQLGSSERDRTSSVLSCLSDPTLRGEWPALILLIELYSRCLLTLGDDEFFSQSKNPLSLDEVVGLTAIGRNLAFALYWQESSLAGWKDSRIVGTRVDLDALRSMTTVLLQQVHARDSRRYFTPPDHWLMTSQFDLASFIQAVIYEDQVNADAIDDDEHGVPRRQVIVEEEEEVELSGRVPRRATQKAKMSTRQMAFIGPRQGVLTNIPFVIPFESRVAIFRQSIQNDRKRLGIERHVYDRQRRHKAVIRRNNLSSDAYAALNGLGAALKSTIEIVFVDQHGLEEKGIDGGGLFKELLTSLSKEAFDTDRGLWLATKEQELYPNPHAYARDSTQLSWYSFLGRILGKALYEGILVDVRFAGFFLSKWLGKQSYLDDLSSLDPELFDGMIFLKNFRGNVEADLSLNFTVTDDDFGIQRTIDLIPNGSEIPVTNENRLSYCILTSNYRLNLSIEKQCAAFFSGLSEIIPARSLKMFNQSELRMLVGGVDQAIDLDDLRLNTVYGGWAGDEANETIRDFWSVVESFDKDDRGKLVKFVTSCARPPLLGFSELDPRFAIRMAGNDETRLPTSSTCVNLLKLPAYTNRENLKTKLLYAINSNAGFDLS